MRYSNTQSESPWFVLVTPRLLDLLNPQINGIALFPFVLLKKKYMAFDQVLLNHEKIHLRQQAELLVIPFYLLYLLFYFTNLVIYRSHQKAYLNNPFEKEAYAHEFDLNYLKKRKAFSFKKFL